MRLPRCTVCAAPMRLLRCSFRISESARASVRSGKQKWQVDTAKYGRPRFPTYASGPMQGETDRGLRGLT